MRKELFPASYMMLSARPVNGIAKFLVIISVVGLHSSSISTETRGPPCRSPQTYFIPVYRSRRLASVCRRVAHQVAIQDASPKRWTAGGEGAVTARVTLFGDLFYSVVATVWGKHKKAAT